MLEEVQLLTDQHTGERLGLNDFYKNLKSFSNFDLLSTDRIYTEVPNDWFVVICDVEKSTQHISLGKYRDVNTIGAGAIVVVQSVMPSDELAFVFGGDGASFLIAPSQIDEIKKKLAQYKLFCIKQFDIELRVGVVSVQEIKSSGSKLEVAKFDGASGKCTAFIRGGGLAWAEYTIKSSPRKYSIKAAQEISGLALNSLSCRWQPLASQRGQMLSLLVQPRLFDSTKIFENLLLEFKKIFGGDLDIANPVSQKSFRYQGFFASIRKEWRLIENKFSMQALGRLTQILVCQWAFRFGLPVPFDAKAYINGLSNHSDYRKYDDTLRLVLDCSKNEIVAVETLLHVLYERGEIFYGTFVSSHALMTCLVENLNQGGHIHLIDGSDGGYSVAAQNLAKQRQLQLPNFSVV